ncbi:hypothetical protein AKJ16_DCAP04767 [Drosera capensis]
MKRDKTPNHSCCIVSPHNLSFPFSCLSLTHFQLNSTHSQTLLQIHQPREVGFVLGVSSISISNFLFASHQVCCFLRVGGFWGLGFILHGMGAIQWRLRFGGCGDGNCGEIVE